jgi:NADH-quinone oxidoreductase subunit L
MLLNRVGDFALLIAIFLVCFVFSSLNYAAIFSLVPLITEKVFFAFGLNLSVIDVVCILLFLGAMGKSAQLGLHT